MNRLKKALILTSGCIIICVALNACSSKKEAGTSSTQTNSSSKDQPNQNTSDTATDASQGAKNSGAKETPDQQILSPGSCACEQGQTAPLSFNTDATARMIPGLMTPGIALYYQITPQDEQTLVTIADTKQQPIKLDDQEAFVMGSDITITQMQTCNVGIYQASLSKDVRQSGTFCGTQDCYTADQVTMNLFDFSNMPTVEKTPSHSYQCLPTHLKDQSQNQWALFLLMENPDTPGTFYFISDQQVTLALTNDDKTTFTLDLAPILATFDQSLADFPKLEGQALEALYQITAEELEIEFKANFISAQGQQATHLTGTLTLGDQLLYVMGHPLSMPVPNP